MMWGVVGEGWEWGPVSLEGGSVEAGNMDGEKPGKTGVGLSEHM